MTEQLELQFSVTAKRRDELLRLVKFRGRKNKMLLGGILILVDRYKPGQCYLSHEGFAELLKCNPRTIRRAIKHLEDLDLVAKVRYSKHGKSLNHYTIVWSALESYVKAEQGESVSIDQADSCDIPSGQLDPTKRTVAPYQADSCDIPSGQLDHTKRTLCCPPIEREYKEEHTKNTEWDSECVVFLESLSEAGLIDPAATLQTAMNDHHLSRDQVRQRIDAGKSLPYSAKKAGTIYNWLTKPGSFDRCAEVAEPPQLQLAKLPSNSHEIRRASLIRYGRGLSWSHQQLQAAVDKLETEILQRHEVIA